MARLLPLSLLALLALLVAGCTPQAAPPAPTPAEPAPIDDEAAPASIHELTVETLGGTPQALADYRGRALLVVNTATGCGLTPQLADLEALRARYADRGFEILAFPSDDFDQDPGTAAESAAAMSGQYSIGFPVFAKARVKGDAKSPLFELLTRDATGASVDVSWNFAKFLVDPDGRVVARFDPRTAPLSDELTGAIERVLPPQRAHPKE